MLISDIFGIFDYMRKKYTIDEILSMGQQEISMIHESENNMLSEGIISESSLNIDYGNMSIEEIEAKYGLSDWEDVKNEIWSRLH